MNNFIYQIFLKSLVISTMKQIKNWQKSIAMTTLVLPALTAFATPSTAASTATPQEIQLSALERTFFQNESVYQLAQVSDNCRQVAPSSGLYVRREPSVYSTAIGIVAGGRYVTIVDNRSANRWVPISAPLQGYVYAGFLKSCQSSPPPNNCRQVSARGGLYVRQEPSNNSAVVGIVANRRNVTIENPSANRWVPISAPLRGYVSTAYLTSCA